MPSPRLILLCLGVAGCVPLLAQSRGVALARQLRGVARELDLGLVYSPGIVPDTSVARVTGPDALDSLTRPFGLGYAIIGEQLVVSRAASRPYSISGFVEDATTGERLVGATVVVSGEGRGAVTNGYGFFVLADVTAVDSLDLRYVGYPSMRAAVPPPDRPAREFTVRMRPSLSLGTVEVTASAAPEARVLAGTPRPQPAEALERSELVTGDRDVNAFLGLIPGVQSAPGGFGGYSVRGADPSQNLVLLDDATLYLPSHANGLLSSVPGTAVRSLQLFKDGGPARFGDRVGAVLDLRLKEGTRAGHELTPTVSLTDLGLAAEGPMGAGSYFVAGRRSVTDQWIGVLRRLGSIDVPNIQVGYYDLTAKVNYPVAPGHRVYASVFYGGDRYRDAASASVTDDLGVTGYRDASERAATNAIVSLRHATAIGDRGFVNTTLTLSQFDFLAEDVIRVEQRPREAEAVYTWSEDLFRTNVLDLGFRQDLTFAVRPDLRLAFGVDAVSHRFRVGTATDIGLRSPTADSTIGSSVPEEALPQLQSYDLSTYLSGVYEPSDKWRVEGGLRLATQVGLRRTFAAVLPRLALSYEFGDRLGLDFGAGVTRQFIHRVSTRNPGLPRELYVPTIGRLRPQSARYVSASLRYALPGGLAVSAGGYARLLGGLARFDGAFEGLGLSNWIGNVRRGTGWARGLEFEAAAPLGRATLAATYTLARSERTFEDGFGPLPTERYRFDRRHNATFTWRQRLSTRWEASATMRVGSGLPVQIPTIDPDLPLPPPGAAPLTNPYTYDGGLIVLPTFHSLDLGGRYRLETDGATWRLGLGVQNAYVNANPIFVSFGVAQQTEAGAVSVGPTQVLLVPVLPFARLSATLKYASRPPDSYARGARDRERL